MTIQVKCPDCKALLTFDDIQCPDDLTVCPQCKGSFNPYKARLVQSQVMVGGMAKRFRWVLWTAFISLPVIFGWLNFQDVDFVKVSKQLEVDFLLKMSMALYFLSWSLGAEWETSDMESYYAVPPNRGKLPWGGVVAIVFLVIAGAVLCVVHSSKWFALALVGFWAVDYLGWIYLGKVVRPIVAESLEMYEKAKEYDKLESLLVFNELNQGVWKWWRAGAGLVCLIFLNLLAFSRLSQILGDAAGGLTGEFVLAISILGYFLLFEGWIWFKRIRARNCYHLIANLAEKYNLSPKKPLSVIPFTPPAVVLPATPAAI
jgi:hypothetical protein